MYDVAIIGAGIAGMATYGARNDREVPPQTGSIGPTNLKAIWEPNVYVRQIPKLFEHLRAKLGDEVELLHDVHERVSLSQGVQLCKDLDF